MKIDMITDNVHEDSSKLKSFRDKDSNDNLEVNFLKSKDINKNVIPNTNTMTIER